MKRRFAAVVAVLAGGVLGFDAGVAAAQGPTQNVHANDDDARLRTLLIQSSQAYEAGNLRRCRDLRLQAWKLRQSYDIAGSLGKAEFELGNYAEAAKFEAFALKYFPPIHRDEESLRRLEATKMELALIRKKVATVRIRVKPESAAVRVDGARVGEAPFGLDEVFVTPGSHVVAAEHHGQSVSQSFVAKAGEERQIELAVPTDAPLATPITSSTPNIATEHYAWPGKASPVVVLLGGTLAVAGIGAGIGFQLDASSARKDLDASVKDIQPGECWNPGASSLGSECSAVNDLGHRVDRSKNISAVSFALGGTALVATAIYWLWPRKSLNVAVAPSVSTSGLGLSATSSF